MWICPNCKTDVEDNFDTCWNCSSNIDGVVDAEFSHADYMHQPLIVCSNTQRFTFRFGMPVLLGLMTVASFLFWMVGLGYGTLLIGLLIFATPTAVFLYLLRVENGPFGPLFRDRRSGLGDHETPLSNDPRYVFDFQRSSTNIGDIDSPGSLSHLDRPQITH